MPARHAHQDESSGQIARVAVLTVSDTRNEAQDRSGAVAREMIESAGHRVAGYAIVPDEAETVRARLRGWIADSAVDGVVVNGGTGISPRDRTYEAVDGLLERRLVGFGELFRMLSYREIGSAAMLSRATGGIVGSKFLFSLPGSTAAVTLGLRELILPELGHLLGQLRKEA